MLVFFSLLRCNALIKIFRAFGLIMPNHRFSIYIIFISLLTLGHISDAAAQEGVNNQSGNQFQLSLASEVGNVDNFLYSTENKKNTSFIKLSPRLFLQTEHERQLFNFSMNSSHTKYQNFSQDDNSNLALNSNYQYKFADNKTWFISTGLKESYELRGTGISIGAAEQLNKGDEKQSFAFTTGYLYGNTDSVGKLKIELGLSDDSYKTRREQTRILDKKSQFIKLSFDYLISGKSYLATDITYKHLASKFNSSQDKDKYTGLVGLKWQSNVITQVEALLGYQTIKFKDMSFDDDSVFKWRVNVHWSPLDSTKVIFGSERDSQEANRLLDSYRVVDNYKISVVTNFTDFFQSSINLSYLNEDVIFQDSNQKEAYVIGDIAFKYQRNEWLSVYLQYIYHDLDTNQAELSYQRNGISLGFSVSIL